MNVLNNPIKLRIRMMWLMFNRWIPITPNTPPEKNEDDNTSTALAKLVEYIKPRV